MRTLSAAVLTTALSILPIAAQATTYAGSDDGASTAGPFTNSAAAEASFLADAASYGALTSLDFENFAAGYSTNYAAPGASLTLTGPNFGAGFSGVSNTTAGDLYGFNVTAGGSQWLGFPNGTLTFNFDQISHAFGFYATGVQSAFGATIQVNYNNGSSQTFDLAANANGGASYFGFTDAQGFNSITISRPGSDAWGVDNVTYGVGSAVPEPATWAMMITGFGLAGTALRRRRSLALAA
ncbi:PEPxxWA-CTERM sorting domain-containing protein [Phenylobacterium sp.]|uniref:PEPxxWA-CTERM sorting domain-containing protein n=1 Tax=Phenylobacterium sp. TaxID=1871053 RepID=UPI0025CD1ED5|nr:PEPxxWA-CTERM sorting domain-containing protein [Phenylobacterium sp.]